MYVISYYIRLYHHIVCVIALLLEAVAVRLQGPEAEDRPQQGVKRLEARLITKCNRNRYIVSISIVY